MQSVIDEFGKDIDVLTLASAVIGGVCARLQELGYDHLTIWALLWARAANEDLWKELHKKRKKR